MALFGLIKPRDKRPDWARVDPPEPDTPSWVEDAPYSPLYDEDGPGDPEFGQWLDGELDRRFPQQRPAGERWFQKRYWEGRRKRWWLVRGIAATIALFILLVAWLLVTAPLSKSLKPIAPPQVTLLASDGTPIARNGAVVDRPVKIADLPPHVAQAFIATEDRRFYSHWGVDPRAIARAAWTG